MSSSEPRHPIWRMVKIGLGILLLPLGIVGLFLPVLQGVLFLAVAVLLLGSEIPFVKRLQERAKERYPGPWKQAERLRHNVSRWLGFEERSEDPDELH